MSTWVLVRTEECTWYLVHENAILSIRAHPWNNTISPGYQLIVFSVVIEELPSSKGLSCLTSFSLELECAPSTWLLTSTWHTRPQLRLLPQAGRFPTTSVQPVLCHKWNKCSRAQINYQITAVKQCTTHCWPVVSCSPSVWRVHWLSCGCRREREVRVEMSQRSWRRTKKKNNWELLCQASCRPSVYLQSPNTWVVLGWAGLSSWGCHWEGQECWQDVWNGRKD